MPELFERTFIGSLEMENRAVRSATWSGVGDERGYVTERATEFYSELARGQIGLIVTGYQYVMTNGIQLPYMIGNYEDGQVEGLSRLAAAVHAQGGKVIPQIVHTGLRANPKLFRDGDELWAPSALPGPDTGAMAVEATREQILQLVEAFAAAARRAKDAGFDGVQLHGAHGYAINQFLSPAWNQRGDGYGGDLNKRYRFLGEVMEATRAAVGDDFPVLIKLSGHDFLEQGLFPEDAIKIAQRLADDGIAAIEVSGGSSSSPKHFQPARKDVRESKDEAYLVDVAAAVKAAVSVPVITVGGIRSLKTIATVLTERKADYVAMARSFVREPHLIKRWQNGETRRATCISCNGCFETGVKGLGISCKVDRKLKELEAKRARKEQEKP
jgi:2,4-dienoyl-CoA reductase-like NADH-dependent reductase (Old Yellow Enzyme family)